MKTIKILKKFLQIEKMGARGKEKKREREGGGRKRKSTERY